jgi:hypothetical protein
VFSSDFYTTCGNRHQLSKQEMHFFSGAGIFYDELPKHIMLRYLLDNACILASLVSLNQA